MSSFKAFLCSIDETYNFPLLPKVTTIGRDNCDIIINVRNLENFIKCKIYYFSFLFRVQILTHNTQLLNIVKMKVILLYKT
jgi:hypothetical protein